MGLSSSQARLLNLTTRMHQIEYKAAKLEAQKLQMANESKKVYLDYQNAMEKTKIQMKSLTTNASVTFIDATYNTLIEAGYKIEFIDEPPKHTVLTSSGFTQPINQITNIDSISGYHAINSAEDLLAMNNSNDKFILMSDIDLSGVNWTSIQNFKGTLDGNGHVIKNLNMSGTNGGLFDRLSDSNIKNLGIENANIQCSNSAGILALNADARTSFTNCYVTGNVSANYAGGFFASAGGTSGNVVIDNCNALVNLSGNCTGGIVASTGYSGIRISNSWTAGTIAGNTYGGAIVGSVGGNGWYGHNIYSTAEINGQHTGINGNITQNAELGQKYQNVYYAGNSILNNIVENDYVTNISVEELNNLIGSDTLPKNSFQKDENDESYKDSVEWLANALAAGMIILQRPDSKGEYVDVSVATDTDLQEVADESDLRKAEAKYEADMRRIDYKDRKYDYDLAALEAERNAIKNEIETLKTVAKDNVEITFKLFG